MSIQISSHLHEVSTLDGRSLDRVVALIQFVRPAKLALSYMFIFPLPTHLARHPLSIPNTQTPLLSWGVL